MIYNADNMSRFLGNDATDEQAEQFAEYLTGLGWELELIEGAYHAFRDGEAVTEQEWAEALADYE